MRSLMKKFMPQLLLSLALAVLASGLNVMGSAKLGSILSEETLHSTASLYRNLVLVLGLFTAFFLMNFMFTTYNSKLKSRIHNTLRRQYAIQFANESVDHWLEESVGAKLAKHTETMNQLDRNFLDPLTGIAFSFFNILFALFALVRIHWTVGLTTILLFLIMLVLPKFLQNIVVPYSQSLEKANQTLVKVLSDHLEGRLVFTAFQRNLKFVEGIEQTSVAYEEQRFALDRASYIVENAMGILSLVSQLVLLGLIIYLAIKHEAPFGAVLSVASLSGTFMGSVSTVVSSYTRIKANEHLLQLDNVSLDQSTSCSPMPVAVNDLTTISLNEYQLVSYNQLGFTFDKGDKIAIIGESGSGKSTLLKTIFLIDRPYQGSIKLAQKEREQLSSLQILPEVAYLDQTVHIFNTSLKNNMTLFQDVEDSVLLELIERLRLQRLFAVCERNFEYEIRENGKNISGGEKQKIALARAYLSGKKIFILDESLSAIDKKGADEILEELLGRDDLSLIMIAHGLSDEMLAKFSKVVRL